MSEVNNDKKKEKIQVEKETKQRRLFKKTRGGIVLTKEQVKEIKAGRKKLKAQMKEKKVYSRKEFEVTASSMGLYFDKRKFGCLFWWLNGKLLPALLGALAAFLLTLYVFSTVTRLRGHFTINLGDDLFLRGFSLSEEEEFENPTSQLYSEPVKDAPAISIVSIPEDVNNYEGTQSTSTYFAYTFFLRYEADDDVPADYAYELIINSESKDLSTAAWVMLFVNDEMTFYAKPDKDGNIEALPALDDNTRGYKDLPLMDQTVDSSQYEEIKSSGSTTYYRVLPKPFESDKVITSGKFENMKPGDVHKFTVVLWLEGDDPDCVDALIGGNLGVEMQFELLDSETGEKSSGSLADRLEAIWKSLFSFGD